MEGLNGGETGCSEFYGGYREEGEGAPLAPEQVYSSGYTWRAALRVCRKVIIE